MSTPIDCSNPMFALQAKLLLEQLQREKASDDSSTAAVAPTLLNLFATDAMLPPVATQSLCEVASASATLSASERAMVEKAGLPSLSPTEQAMLEKLRSTPFSALSPSEQAMFEKLAVTPLSPTERAMLEKIESTSLSPTERMMLRDFRP